MLLEVKIVDTVVGSGIETGREHKGVFWGLYNILFYDMRTGYMIVFCF